MTRLASHPLPALTVAEATALQHRLVAALCEWLDGWALVSDGDRGLRPELGRPLRTAAVEATLADFFGLPAAALVRGAGTGALRAAIEALLPPGGRILVHRAPVYTTTAGTLAALGITAVPVDFNDLTALKAAVSDGDGSVGPIDGALIQHSRQLLSDAYAIGDVIATLRAARPGLPLISDDNYAALRVPAIGAQLGATVSTFSTFKLLGPEGVGCVTGNATVIDAIHRRNYSGGTQVQGPEAMAVVRGMVYAPVALALQALVVDQVVARLNAGELAGVVGATVASSQSRVALVELTEPLAPGVLKLAPTFGAAPYPIGAESRYELAPLFYRVSGTMLAADPQLAERVIRINPLRAGADSVISILARALTGAGAESKERQEQV